jgi:NDP-sugar pyrophosphorylase family protein
MDGKLYLDMPDLLNKEINKGGVSVFPVHEYWLDIGHLNEYEKANKEIKDML